MKNAISALCGVALLHVALGSLATLAFPSAAAFRSSCAPDGILHALVQCDGATLNRVWSWTMGIPRFLFLWPVLTILLLQTVGANFGSHATEAVIVQTISGLGLMALAAATWIGFRFWQQRAPVVMWLLLIVFGGFSAMYAIPLIPRDAIDPSLESPPRSPSPPP